VVERSRESLIVIGNGMAGARVVEEILARAPERFEITMFGDEPCGNYNRIQLSGVLGRFKDPTEIMLNGFEWYEQNQIRLHAGVRAERINPRERIVVGRPVRNGKTTSVELEEPYDKLILATGSRPFVPPIEGTDKGGIFVFRTIDDCGAIASWASESKQAVVIGGGLLGLEAARGLLTHGVSVTVVEVAPHLMVQQLDAAAAAILKQRMEAMGVRVLLDKLTTRVLGNGRVEALEFKDGAVLDADMVVISCGIRPNAEIAKAAGLSVDRAVLVDDQLRTSNPYIFAVGECTEHRGRTYGLVEPLYEQAKVLADVITEANREARYEGSRLATTLKVMGVDLMSLGEVNGQVAAAAESEVVVHSEPSRGLYHKLVVREGKLAGAIVLGSTASMGLLMRMFKRNEPVPEQPLELLLRAADRTGACQSGEMDTRGGVTGLPDDSEICNCHHVSKQLIVECIRHGHTSVKAIGARCKAGTGCGSCQTLLDQLIDAYGAPQATGESRLNKVELMKREKDGLDALPDIYRYAASGDWTQISEDDTQRMKWHGLFLRKPTPGHFMMRIRATCGHMNAGQWRVIADLSDKYGKGFCDLTTRQQVQMRWFSIRDVPEIWEQLSNVGLTSAQTGMDNVRGVCGCPVAGITPNELIDASAVAQQFTDMLVGNRDFTNLPRKFNVTITGCLDNCCHPETQDIALVPAVKEIDGQPVTGFNVLVGGKQGSGGYRPASKLDVFVLPDEAAELCKHTVFIFRDHGAREARNRSRLAFLIDERGDAWFRRELEQRWGRPLRTAGSDQRKKQHTDHVGIYRQKQPGLNYVGLLVPVGRVTTDQMRRIASIAEQYGDGQIRLTTEQNIVITGVPDAKVGDLTQEPLLRELQYNPTAIMRGLVSCTGIDYCHLALIETKGWAIEIARKLEERLGTDVDRLEPLTIHWSGCPAGCGMHQVSSIGLQGCRSRQASGEIVDSAHVFVRGSTGPQARVATELLNDVPCSRLTDALLPLVKYLPRKV
jgi:nitrite reductase [NAD(P)H] large subunit